MTTNQTDENTRHDYWLSWYTGVPLSEFELHSPWWVSGYTDDETIVVAAVRAESEKAAFAQVRAAYDNDPGPLRERFIEPLTGSPFRSRFPQAEWMAWDAERTCGCADQHSILPEKKNSDHDAGHPSGFDCNGEPLASEHEVCARR